MPFHNSITGHYTVDKDRLETNLLQLFAHPENSKWFIIFVIVFEVNTVAEQKQAYLVGMPYAPFYAGQSRFNGFVPVSLPKSPG